MKKQAPLLIEVITCIPTTFVQCGGCETAFGLGAMTNKLHAEQLNAFPVDFTPTDRNVLYGYQFKSIAAAGPIVGAITAANL